MKVFLSLDIHLYQLINNNNSNNRLAEKLHGIHMTVLYTLYIALFIKGLQCYTEYMLLLPWRILILVGEMVFGGHPSMYSMIFSNQENFIILQKGTRALSIRGCQCVQPASPSLRIVFCHWLSVHMHVIFRLRSQA